MKQRGDVDHMASLLVGPVQHHQNPLPDYQYHHCGPNYALDQASTLPPAAAVKRSATMETEKVPILLFSLQISFPFPSAFCVY